MTTKLQIMLTCVACSPPTIGLRPAAGASVASGKVISPSLPSLITT